MKKRSINYCSLSLLFLLLFSCNGTEEGDPKTEIAVDSFWAYTNGCFEEVFQGLSMGESIRITDYEDFAQIVPCFINEEIPEVNLEEFFLLITRFESVNVPVVKNQAFFRKGTHEFIYEIEVQISDFFMIDAVFCFGVIPIELLNNDIKIEFI